MNPDPPPPFCESSHSPPKRKIDRARAPGLDNDDREFRKKLRDQIRFRRGDESCNAPEPLIFRLIAFNLTQFRTRAAKFRHVFFSGSPRGNFRAHDRFPPVNFYHNFLDRSISTAILRILNILMDVLTIHMILLTLAHVLKFSPSRAKVNKEITCRRAISQIFTERRVVSIRKKKVSIIPPPPATISLL